MSGSNATKRCGNDSCSHLERVIENEVAAELYDQAKTLESYTKDDQYPEPYRYITNWFLARPSNTSIRKPLPKTQSGFQNVALYGELEPSHQLPNDVQSKIDTLHVVIYNLERWDLDRHRYGRGIWIMSERCCYKLKKPCSLHKRQKDGYVSQEDLMVPFRANLGLINNIVDMFCNEDGTINESYLKFHAGLYPWESHKLLTPNEEMLRRYPFLHVEPFDLELLKREALFVKTHLRNYDNLLSPKCRFLTGLNMMVRDFTTAKRSNEEWTLQEFDFLNSALKSEKRSGRYPWGDPKFDGTDSWKNSLCNLMLLPEFNKMLHEQNYKMLHLDQPNIPESLSLKSNGTGEKEMKKSESSDNVVGTSVAINNFSRTEAMNAQVVGLNKNASNVGVFEVSKKSNAPQNQLLVGKGYFHTWIDGLGKQKTACGIVKSFTSNVKNEDKKVNFCVEYCEESMRSMKTLQDVKLVNKLQNIDSSLAWGGCIAYEQKLLTSDKLKSVTKACEGSHLPIKYWTTPEMRYEELIETRKGQKLPRLTLTFRGCNLVFSVKKSSIPNAGLGVFVKCVPLSPELQIESLNLPSYDLRPGELLDMGIYAPFRKEDKKPLFLFKLKNYLMSGACEEWCFDCTDDAYQFDITDETGEVHALAKQHIPMYVNECGMDEVPSVHAEHDPEGSVHYLFGIYHYGSMDNFKDGLHQLGLKVGGKEVEIFVNYGIEYERVRVRKGYSSLPLDKQDAFMDEMMKDEEEYVNEIDELGKSDISQCLDYFSKEFISRSKVQSDAFDDMMDGEMRERALRILEKFKIRLNFLQTQCEEKKDLSLHESLSKLSHLTDDLISTLLSIPIFFKPKPYNQFKRRKLK